MTTKTTDIARAYYTAMGQKNIAGVEKCLHSDIEFIAPLAKVQGKEAMLKAAKGFMNLFNALTIRAVFGNENQAVVIYDLQCPAPINTFATAAFMTFKDGLIVRLELLFDARPFEKKS